MRFGALFLETSQNTQFDRRSTDNAGTPFLVDFSFEYRVLMVFECYS
jgi:hypothetical protein